MDINDYIEIISTSNKVLHFKVKGFWSNKLISCCEDKIFQVWKKAVDSFGGQKFISLPDLTEFKPSQEKGTELVAKLMKYAQENNLYHSVQIAPTALARVNVSVPSSKAGHSAYRTVTKSLEEALKVVEEKLKDI